MDKTLSWVIKITGVIITAPVTAVVAGELFADLWFVLRFVMQGAAVLLVEGVFMYSWVMLEYDKQAELEYKLRHAITALVLYLGLWVLALRHGEGGAGVVFRLALGAALLGTVYDVGVYDWLRSRKRADRDIRNTRAVRKVARNLSQADAVLQLQCDSEYRQAVTLAGHRRRMDRVDEKAAPHTEPPLDRHKSVPAVERDRAVTPGHKRSRADRALAVLRANPHVTLRELGDEIGVSHTTAGRYIDKLMEQGKVRNANGAGYEVLV